MWVLLSVRVRVFCCGRFGRLPTALLAAKQSSHHLVAVAFRHLSLPQASTTTGLATGKEGRILEHPARSFHSRVESPSHPYGTGYRIHSAQSTLPSYLLSPYLNYCSVGTLCCCCCCCSCCLRRPPIFFSPLPRPTISPKACWGCGGTARQRTNPASPGCSSSEAKLNASHRTHLSVGLSDSYSA